MADSFSKLRLQLEAVENWLEQYDPSASTKKERDLAASLRNYIEHCYRDERKWRSEFEAEDAIFKINSVWLKLYKPQLRKD